MKRVKRKNLTKQIICIIIFLMLCNFIIPNYSYAANDEESGVIFAPISKFITFLCDSMMQFLQDTFTTTEKIKQEDGTYNFQYSPAIIFSGTVLALDINFIVPNTDIRNIDNYDAYIRNMEEEYYKEAIGTGGNVYITNQNSYMSYLEQAKKNSGYKEYSNRHYKFFLTTSTTTIYYEKNIGGKNYLCIEYFQISNFVDGSKSYVYRKIQNELTEQYLNEMNARVTYSSIASQLQPTIATWYNALRKIALVGLLSVLVYIGIQIVLTSASGKENSKYKKMLTDWLIALCLLFTLHYIMSATLVITKQISNIFNTGETDHLLNTLRTEIERGKTWEEVVSQVIMYVVMVIYTVVFSFQYLKRVLYMGFYTMIAPLVTLTYPLDKIKDSKAQAFTMWMREYIFNALIQVVHLVVYYVLVGSALSLVDIFPLYGILAIGFITQGEKIIRKMFGFDNATTVGTMGAAATGGLITAALNKLQKVSKPSKKTEVSKDSTNNNVRTVSNNALASLRNKGNASKTEEKTKTSLGKETNSIKNSETEPKETDKQDIWKNGAKSLGGKYGLKALKGAGDFALGAGLGATGAMIGFASGVADGDLGKALSGAAAGGTAGYGLGKGSINGVKNTLKNTKQSINNVQDTFNEGAYGKEEAKNMKEMREFKEGSAYKSLKDTYGDDLTDDKLKAMLQAGISEKEDMKKILESSNMDDAIGYYTLAKNCPDDIYYDDAKMQKYLEDLGLSQTDATTMRTKMREFR